MDKRTERYVKIHDLNKSDERVEFERTHTLHMGILENEGVKDIIEVDKNNPDQILKRYSSMELRCRMNGQRNGSVCGFWVDNLLLPNIKKEINSEYIQNYLRKIAYKI